MFVFTLTLTEIQHTSPFVVVSYWPILVSTYACRWYIWCGTKQMRRRLRHFVVHTYSKYTPRFSTVDLDRQCI